MSERPEFRRMRADHLTVLSDALDGMALADYEQRILRWLAGWDRPTVEAVADLFRKARGTAVRADDERKRSARLRHRLAEADAELAELRRTCVHLETRVTRLNARNEELLAALREVRS